MADLKTVQVSLVADIGNYEGDSLGLTNYLREKAIVDLVGLCSTQLIHPEDLNGDNVGSYYDEDILGVEGESGVVLEETVAEPTETVPQKLSEILDTNLSTKISSFQEVIRYLDEIIKLDGVVAETVTPEAIITKFKTLEGLYSTFGQFTISSGMKVV